MLWVRVRVDFRVRVRVGVGIRVNLTLTKTLKLNPKLLSYWECCRNMVMKKKFAPGTPREADESAHGGWMYDVGLERKMADDRRRW